MSIRKQKKTFSFYNESLSDHEKMILMTRANEISLKLQRDYSLPLINEIVKNNNSLILFISQLYSLFYDVKLCSGVNRVGINVEIKEINNVDHEQLALFLAGGIQNVKIISCFIGPLDPVTGHIVEKGVYSKVTEIPRNSNDELVEKQTLTEKILVGGFRFEFLLYFDVALELVTSQISEIIATLVLRSYGCFNNLQVAVCNKSSIATIIKNSIGEIINATSMCKDTVNLLNLDSIEQKRVDSIIVDIMHDQWQLQSFLEEFNKKLKI